MYCVYYIFSALIVKQVKYESALSPVRPLSKRYTPSYTLTQPTSDLKVSWSAEGFLSAVRTISGRKWKQATSK